jgi:hypothetical protein
MTRKTKLYILSFATVLMAVAAIVIPLIPVKLFMIALLVCMHLFFARNSKAAPKEEEMIMLSEDVWQQSHKDAEPITLRETVHETVVMHEEVREEAKETKDKRSSSYSKP